MMVGILVKSGLFRDKQVTDAYIGKFDWF